MVFQMLLKTFFLPVLYIYWSTFTRKYYIHLYFQGTPLFKTSVFYSKGLIGQHSMSPYFDHLFVALIILI